MNQVQPTPQSSTPAPAGVFDIITATTIAGWLQLARPGGGVEILVNGQRLGSAKTFIERPDLAAATVVTRCGFHFELPAGIRLGDGDTVAVNRIGADTPPLEQVIDAEFIAGTLEHRVDISDDRAILGWACWRFDPSRRVTIDIEISDRPRGQVVANRFRDDLRTAGIGDGYHGFEIDVTALGKAEGGEATIHLLVNGVRVSVVQRAVETLHDAAELAEAVEGPALAIVVPPVWSSEMWRNSMVVPEPFWRGTDSGNPQLPVPLFAEHLFTRHMQGRPAPTSDGLLGALLRGIDGRHAHVAAEIRFNDALLAIAREQVLVDGKRIPRILYAYWRIYRPNLKLANDLNALHYDFTVDVCLRWKLDRRLITQSMWSALTAEVSIAGISGAIPALFGMLYTNNQQMVQSMASLDPQTRGRLLVMLGVVLFAPAGVQQRLTAKLLDATTDALAIIRASNGWAALARCLGWPNDQRVWDATLGLPPEPVVPATLKSGQLPGVRVFSTDRPGTGLGQNVDYTLAALKRVDVPFRLVQAGDRQSLTATLDDDGSRPWVNLFHVQPDNLPLVFSALPDTTRRAARNIGFFMWELRQLAPAHRLGVELVDEVWTATEFTRAIFQDATIHPVIRVGHAVEPATPSSRDFRRELDIEDKVVFVFAFDANSGLGRKNPVGAAAAFIRAFGPRPERAHLVIKTANLANQVANPQVEVLNDLITRCEGISLIDNRLGAADYSALIARSDCYVSLHRSEGFGYTPAEAMYFGRPVIATDFSGTTDFCRKDNVLLVPGRMVPLAKADFIYEVPGSEWAEPDLDAAAAAMRRVVEEREEMAELGQRAQAVIREEFSIDRLAERYRQRLVQIAAEYGAGQVHG